MLWVPQKGSLLVQHNTGSIGAGAPGTSVTTGAASSTKGAVAEIYSATLFDAYWVSILANGYAASVVDSRGAMDILIGAATESVLIANLLFGGASTIGTRAGMKRWDFPLYIPAGSRLAVQAAGMRLSTAFSVAMYLYGGHGHPPFRVGQKVTTYGMGTVPDGTTIVPGINGADGTWTQIAASTNEDHFAFVPSFQDGDTVVGDRLINLSMGIGVATEQEIQSGAWWNTSSVEGVGGPMPCMPAFADVPAGTRLAMRASNNSTNDVLYNACIHAVS